MENAERVVVTGTLKEGKERHGSMRGNQGMCFEEAIARIKFKRTIRRIIKLIQKKD